jgi:hypothetical protein
MNDFKLMRKIGGKGEGPGEFRTQPLLHLTPGHILLYSFSKIAIFSREGKLLKEKRFPNMMIGPVERIGDNFVVQYFLFITPSISKIALFDKDFCEVKTIYSDKKPLGPIEGGEKVLRLLPTFAFFKCWKDKIYIVDTQKGFYIESFDINGNSLGVIRKNFPKVKVSEQYKSTRIKNFLRKFNGAKKKKILKLFEFRFPEYFPDIMDLSISDSMFYVKTYRNQNGKEEYIILDLKGKILKKVLLPETSPKGYYFYNNGFYYLQENEEEEEWELHCLEIK